VHVLIGTDGTALSVSAAQRGMAILGRPDRVTLLAVMSAISDIDDGGFGGSTYSPREQEELRRLEVVKAHDEVARTAAGLTDAPIDSRIESGDDGVASTICDVAGELGVDVIVVGSHARGGLGLLLLGSVSEHVVRHAPCPVLVVRERNSADESSG
jgi:nucleotide-binding universal stress UspA family protein